MKNEIRKEVYSREFKLKFFGDGEWVDEPDRIEFEFNGIKCIVIRMVTREPYVKEETYFGGHLCGYIILSENHPLYGEELDLACHGGITFCKIIEKKQIIGFDCSHSTDLIPSMVVLRKKDQLDKIFTFPEEFTSLSIFKSSYKNIAFCIEECKSLVTQISQ